jgi:hypothetical protein
MPRRVNAFERRAQTAYSLGLGQRPSGPEHPQKLCCLALQPGKEAQLLKNQRPGKQREEEQNAQDDPGHPSRLRQKRAQLALIEQMKM